MLRFENLSKRYGERTLFNALSYNAGPGCIAFSDETGSGKTTLLGILAGTVEADEGEVWIGGYSLAGEPVAARRALAYIPDDCMTSPLQTGREFLDQVASGRETMVGPAALDLAERFGLSPHLDKRFEQMSFGTRKKLHLAATVLGSPAVIIADEPAAGLDAPARAVLSELFGLLGRDRTVIFSTYDPDLALACHARTVGFADLRT